MRVGSRLLLAIVLANGCKGDEAPPSADAPADVSAARPSNATRRAAFELKAEGVAWATATPKDGGYKLKDADGTKIGKIKVEADRVKVKDAADTTKAKVKLKDDGFKIYEGDSTAVAKAKRKGAGWKLERADGTVLGEVDTHGPGGEIGGSTITVETAGQQHVVARDGKELGSVGSAISPSAAAFLGVSELTWEQRVAAMVFVEEQGT